MIDDDFDVLGLLTKKKSRVEPTFWAFLAQIGLF
jgi:hypothetical protein